MMDLLDCRAVCTKDTTNVDREGGRGMLRWDEELPALLVGDPSAQLCIELRDRDTVSLAGTGRAALGGSSWRHIGAVRTML
jgi:hypothetical protein